MNPVVSVVIITYNSEEYVLSALESVKAQTYPLLELIVSDDCSTDNTLNICRQWVEENNSRFTRARVIGVDSNTGTPGNCNRGVMESEGEWIKILAGDDILLPEAVEVLISEAYKDNRVKKYALHGRIVVEDDENDDDFNHWGDPRDQNFNKDSVSASEQFNILLRFCPISAPTVLLERSLFEQYGYFDERFKFWEDRPMWLKLTSKGVKFYFVDQNLVKYRRHNDSVQKNAYGTLFSRTQISKDNGAKEVILPYLPGIERALNIYLILVRRFLLNISGNRKNIFTRMLNRGLTFPAESCLHQITCRYSP